MRSVGVDLFGQTAVAVPHQLHANAKRHPVGELRAARQDHSRPEAARLGETLADALRLRAINAELAAAGATASACLGVLWEKGEPDGRALASARAWGDSLHAQLVACAGEDLVWLGSLRQLLASLFTEGPACYAANTAIGARLTRFRGALATFDTALDAFANESRLRRATVVAARLRGAGYEVHHQVGCSGYRIDLAVVDPATSGRYLLGIECDGATYHRAATARDRDKLRQLILEGLGWKLRRIWSTDWWHDADKEMEQLLAALKVAEIAGPNGG